MSYFKIIQYADITETYEYEREPVPQRKRTPRVRKERLSDENLDASGQHTLQERKLGKRRDNARRAKLAFRRLVASNLSRTAPPILISLTYRENQTDLSIGYKDYRSFVQALRYKYGKDFRYICVPEFQTRGAVHFHTLFWGLPAELVLQERTTRTIAMIWGHGFVDIIKTDGHSKISSYLAKYMAKAFIDPRLRNQKAYASSRNVMRPVITTGTTSLQNILPHLVGDNSLVVTEGKYWTPWLGDCKHQMHKIFKDTQI